VQDRLRNKAGEAAFDANYAANLLGTAQAGRSAALDVVAAVAEDTILEGTEWLDKLSEETGLKPPTASDIAEYDKEINGYTSAMDVAADRLSDLNDRQGMIAEACDGQPTKVDIGPFVLSRCVSPAVPFLKSFSIISLW